MYTQNFLRTALGKYFGETEGRVKNFDVKLDDKMCGFYTKLQDSVKRFKRRPREVAPSLDSLALDMEQNMEQQNATNNFLEEIQADTTKCHNEIMRSIGTVRDDAIRFLKDVGDIQAEKHFTSAIQNFEGLIQESFDNLRGKIKRYEAKRLLEVNALLNDMRMDNITVVFKLGKGEKVIPLSVNQEAESVTIKIHNRPRELDDNNRKEKVFIIHSEDFEKLKVLLNKNDSELKQSLAGTIVSLLLPNLAPDRAYVPNDATECIMMLANTKDKDAANRTIDNAINKMMRDPKIAPIIQEMRAEARSSFTQRLQDKQNNSIGYNSHPK